MKTFLEWFAGKLYDSLVDIMFTKDSSFFTERVASALLNDADFINGVSDALAKIMSTDEGVLLVDGLSNALTVHTSLTVVDGESILFFVRGNTPEDTIDGLVASTSELMPSNKFAVIALDGPLNIVRIQ